MMDNGAIGACGGNSVSVNGSAMISNQPFYGNLAPSAIGGQAIVTTPLLLNQQATSVTTAMSQQTVPSSFAHHPPSLSSMSVHNENVVRELHSNVKGSTVKATGKKFTCRMCHKVKYSMI